MDFFNYSFNLLKIDFACRVLGGTGEPVHNNRYDHGLAFNISGRKKYVFDKNKILYVEKNDVIFLPEKSNYVVYELEKGDCYAINFKIDDNIRFEPFVRKIKNAAGVCDMFRLAEKAFVSKNTGYELKCKSELYMIIYTLISENEVCYASGDIKNKIAPALRYIHDRYTYESINIENLSAMCGISSVYMRKLFLRCMGVSPVKYINSLRLSRAKELIRSEMYSFEQVAELSGFNDISYFYRTFKRNFGTTPMEYKKSCKIK